MLPMLKGFKGFHKRLLVKTIQGIIQVFLRIRAPGNVRAPVPPGQQEIQIG